MKKNIMIRFFFLAMALIVSTTAYHAVAQDGVQMREKVEKLKRTKLVEILELDENAAAKFFAKYDQYENKVQSAFKEARQAMNELNARVDRQAAAAEISQQSEIVLQKQNALHAAVDEKLKAMKPLLTEEQYAKFIVFENKFTQTLREILNKRKNNR
jgi:Spy/CpxP family protein refolding chaperone